MNSLARDGERESGAGTSIREANRITGESGMVIRIDFDQTAFSVVAKDGSVRKSYPAENHSGMVFFLRWADRRGWAIQEIQVDASGDGA
ncbi:hypothetical protein PZ938_16570 [Luteipulveratus sp. YIM 133132]|uniref:hypothetical protein n=1 Tax=Luteipulveratus flavus TaxID=3031728 RepID=UPI0023B1CE15|nr:hypothetical protein [Luteipulveratus sp. YIM 133132]MDE9367235.1 hypothetical protein [Luteipulveratus sp. YIM 133132]